jgi:hypothetical protein
MKLIVCAGRSRSGSTLLYNMVRLTVQTIKGKVYARSHRHFKKSNNNKFQITKIHDYDRYFYNNANYVFTCHRDEKDQRKSIINFRKQIKNKTLSEKELNEFIKYDLRRYKKWKQNTNFSHDFSFDRLVNDKIGCIKKICKVLGFNPNDNQIDKIIKSLNEIKMPDKKYDPETCMTYNHYTSKGFKNE